MKIITVIAYQTGISWSAITYSCLVMDRTMNTTFLFLLLNPTQHIQVWLKIETKPLWTLPSETSFRVLPKLLNSLWQLPTYVPTTKMSKNNAKV